MSDAGPQLNSSRSQPVSHHAGRPLLLEPQLRVAVQVTAERHKRLAPGEDFRTHPGEWPVERS